MPFFTIHASPPSAARAGLKGCSFSLKTKRFSGRGFFCRSPFSPSSAYTSREGLSPAMLTQAICRLPSSPRTKAASLTDGSERARSFFRFMLYRASLAFVVLSVCRYESKSQTPSGERERRETPGQVKSFRVFCRLPSFISPYHTPPVLVSNQASPQAEEAMHLNT